MASSIFHFLVVAGSLLMARTGYATTYSPCEVEVVTASCQPLSEPARADDGVYLAVYARKSCNIDGPASYSLCGAYPYEELQLHLRLNGTQTHAPASFTRMQDCAEGR